MVWNQAALLRSANASPFYRGNSPRKELRDVQKAHKYDPKGVPVVILLTGPSKYDLVVKDGNL